MCGRLVGAFMFHVVCCQGGEGVRMHVCVCTSSLSSVEVVTLHV